MRLKVDPQAEPETGGKRVGASQNEIEIDPLRRLLRLDFRRQFGRGRLGVGEARDEVGLRRRIGVKGALGERQIAGDVDDGDLQRTGRLLRRRENLTAAKCAVGGKAGNAAHEMPASNVHDLLLFSGGASAF
jgi:hypothetical protein